MNSFICQSWKRVTGGRVLTRLILCAFLGLAFPSLGVDRITATVVITNAPTTNGMTFVVTTTSATTRTWTNSVQNSSLQVLTNSTTAGCATNLASNLAFNPPLGVVANLTAASTISIYGNAGVPLTVSGVGSYFSVTYATQSVSQAWTVRVPIAVEAEAQKTNVSSGVSGILEYSGNTNSIDQNSFAVSELVGKTNTQTISGDKYFSGTVIFSNRADVLSVGTLSSTNLNGIVGAITNGNFKTNIFEFPTTTNLINYGDSIASYGSGSSAQQFGLNANASGFQSLAIGGGSQATGYLATAIGNIAIGGDYSVSLGFFARATATNSLALGLGAVADEENSVALGSSANTSAADQIRLGSSSHYVSIPGNLHVIGSSSNNTFRGTNVFPAGSDLSFGRYAITTLANGANSVSLGTNVFIQVSGPSSAFTINGMDAQPNRDGALRIILNYTTQNMTIAHDSGTEPVAANRIYTMTGADHATTGNGCAMFVYSASASRWILINLQE